MATAPYNNKNNVCYICDKPSITSYPLKKCTTCDNLVHRHCTQIPVGQDVICKIAYPQKRKVGIQ